MRFTDHVKRNPSLFRRAIAQTESSIAEAFTSEVPFTAPVFDDEGRIKKDVDSPKRPQRLEEFISVPEVVPFGIRRGSTGALFYSLFIRQLTDEFSQPTVITDHADLNNLNAVDDHDFYYPTDGSRPLTGHVDLGSSGRIFKYNGDEVLTLQGKLNPTDPFIRIANADSGTAPEISVQGGNADLKLAARGSNATFSIDVSTYRIKNVVDPSGAQDAATKNYVDTAITSGTSSLVVGPGSATGNALAIFNGTTGKIIKNSGIILSIGGGNSQILDAGANDLILEGSNIEVGSMSGTDAVNLNSNGVLIVSAPSGVDPIVRFTGSFNGDLIWMEDEARFESNSDALIRTDKKLYLRDTGIFIHSNADSELTIEADGKVLVVGTLALSDSASKPPLNVTERSAEPSSPASGDIYLDDGTNTGSGNPGWRRYTGAAWEDITAAAGGGGGNHAILDGSTHSDSVADAVTRGSLIYGNATPKWDELVIGSDGQYLGSDGTDAAWQGLDIVDDTSPQLSGELDCQDNTVGFTLQTATGDGTTTFDWRLGNKFKFTFGAQNEVFTFTDPSKPCNLILMLIQDATGGRTIANSDAWQAIRFVGNAEPTLSTAPNAIDIIALFFDGTNYYGMATLNFP